MNRFTRNNLLLIIIIACSCVAAVGLLVFSIIRYIDMSRCLAEIESIEKQVKELSRKNPSPHKDNQKPIEANIKIYQTTADKLARYFVHPLKKVAEDFVLGLVESNPRKEDGKVIPLTVEQFRKDYEEMWNKGQSFVDKQYNYNNFRELRYKNWNAQVRAFLPIAQKLTAEPLTEDTLPEALFSYIGIPRVMGEQPDNMVKYMKNYQNALVNILTSIKFNVTHERVDWFGFEPDPKASSLSGTFNSPREHYPQLSRVWEIYGDVIRRMANCKMMMSFTDTDGKKKVVPYSKEIVGRLDTQHIPYTTFDDRVDSFYQLNLRSSMKNFSSSSSNNATERSEALRNAIAGNDEGSFKIYRMRVGVGASMAGIRTFVRALDNAYLENRVYVIKSIALYAESDGADSIFKNKEGEVDNSAAVQTVQAAPEVTARGRGRGRGRVAEPRQTVVENKIDPAELERLKRLQEEAEKRLKFYERPGYGDVLIGDDKTFKAVIDFDCYELK